ncbi:hypothetical protein [Cytobacillus horneckiae]|uniref:hypothetical protein n=1 Tax=Cytobacillus horneckiae TaxID=549687 RepID=UPI003D9A7A89
MSQLRETLLNLQKEKTLRLLLGADYDTATQAQREHFLQIVGAQIEVDVDSMLHEYVLRHRANSPVSQKNNKLKWVHIVGNIVLSLAGAYAINEQEWIFVGFVAILMIIIQYLPFVYDKDQ